MAYFGNGVYDGPPVDDIADGAVDTPDLTAPAEIRFSPLPSLGTAGQELRVDDSSSGFKFQALNTAPDPFTFTDIFNSLRNTQHTSNEVTILGIEAAAIVNITGGEWEKNNDGIWSSSSGTIIEGNSIKVRGTSPLGYNNETNVVLNIGGVEDTFTINNITVDAPSGLTLSTPFEIRVGVATSIDVTVGNDGGDSELAYSWMISTDAGSTWSTDGIDNITDKSPSITINALNLSVKVRVAVTNGGGSTTATSASSFNSIPDITADTDSQFIDTGAQALTDRCYESTIVSGKTFTIAQDGFEVGDKISVSGNIDVVDSIESLYDTTVYPATEVSSNSTTVNFGGVDKRGSISNGDAITLNGDTDVVTTVTGTPVDAVIDGDHGATGAGEFIEGSPSSGDLPSVLTATSQADIHIVYHFSSTKIIILSRDNDDDYSLKSYVGTISGDIISWGGASGVISKGVNVHSESSNMAYKIVKLNNTQVACVFSDTTYIPNPGLGNNGGSAIGTISGSGIDWTINTEQFANDVLFEQNESHLLALTPTKILLLYGRNPSELTAIIGNISNNIVTWGSNIPFDGNTYGYYKVDAVMLSSTKVVVIYTKTATVGNSSSGGWISSIVCTISGDSISFGSIQTPGYSDGRNDSLGMLALDDTRVLLSIRHGNSATNNYQFGTISGTSMAWDTIITVSFALGTMVKYDVDKVALHSNSSPNTNRRVATIDTSGDTITLETDSLIMAGMATASTGIIAHLEDGKFIVFYNKSFSISYLNLMNYISTITTAAVLPANITDVSFLTHNSTSGQNVTLTNNQAINGTVCNMSSYYNTAQVSQQVGQPPFTRVDIDVHYTRNKISASSSGSNLAINGSTPNTTFSNGDSVIVSGASNLYTTINSDPVINEVIGTGIPTNTAPLIIGGSASGSWASIVYIGDDKIVAVWASDPTGNGASAVGTISGNDITWGSIVIINSNVCSRFNIVKVNNNTVAVSYKNNDDNTINMCAATINGTTISWGTTISATEGMVLSYYFNDLLYVGNNTVVMCWYAYYNGQVGRMIAATISGNTITASDTSYSAGVCMTTPRLATIGSGFVMVGTNNFAYDVINSVYCTISGTVITVNATTTAGYGAIGCYDIIQTSTNSVMYLVGTASNFYIAMGILSGTSVSFEDQALAYTGNGWGDLEYIEDGIVILTYTESQESNICKTKRIHYSGTSIIDEGVSPVSIGTISSSRPVNTSIENGRIVSIYNSASSIRTSITDINETSYDTVISTTDALPTNITSIEILPIQIEADLHDSTPNFQSLIETTNISTTTTAITSATLNNDSGMLSDIRVITKDSGITPVTITRIEADYST